MLCTTDGFSPWASCFIWMIPQATRHSYRKAARASRCDPKRLIVRRWTKNCEPPVIGPAFVKAAHTKPVLQTPRQFFRDAGQFRQHVENYEIYATALAQRNINDAGLFIFCTNLNHAYFVLFIF